MSFTNSWTPTSWYIYPACCDSSYVIVSAVRAYTRMDAHISAFSISALVLLVIGTSCGVYVSVLHYVAVPDAFAVFVSSYTALFALTF